LGEGTFGKVRLSTNLRTNEKFAIKCLKKSAIANRENIERVLREILIVKVLKHKHISTLYDVIDTPQEIYMVMEYASGGELFDYIVSKKRIKEKEARRFFRQIISALDYCHSHNVIHRDLKPENILLDKNLDIKIIDFGFSNFFHPGSLMETFCGSPAYAAPEMIKGDKYTGKEADIWSIGVILYALLCGYLPFDDDSNPRLFNLILEAKYELPSCLSATSRDLISKLLRVNPAERLTLAQIAAHPWLQDSGTPVPQPAPKPKIIPGQRRNSTPTLLTKLTSRLNEYGDSEASPVGKEKRYREVETSLDSPDVEEPRVPTPRTLTPNDLPPNGLVDGGVPPLSPPRRRRKFSVPENIVAGFNNLQLDQPILASHSKTPSDEEQPVIMPSHSNLGQDDTFIFASMSAADPALKHYLEKGRRVSSLNPSFSFSSFHLFFFFFFFFFFFSPALGKARPFWKTDRKPTGAQDCGPSSHASDAAARGATGCCPAESLLLSASYPVLPSGT